MTTSEDFDFFLKNGFIEGLNPGSSMDILLNEFGNNSWYIEDRENNGLIYGIIKIGFIEFHIYDEKISGVSYRPDIPFNKKHFKKGSIPWVSKYREISEIEATLSNHKIEYKKYSITGPSRAFKTAGAHFSGLDIGIHTFIDTIGGVTFIFETDEKTEQLETYQICKYYIPE